MSIQVHANKLTNDEYSKLLTLCPFNKTITGRNPTCFIFDSSRLQVIPLNLSNVHVKYAENFNEFMDYYYQTKLEKILE